MVYGSVLDAAQLGLIAEPVEPEVDIARASYRRALALKPGDPNALKGLKSLGAS